jgi:hypothetical protein
MRKLHALMAGTLMFAAAPAVAQPASTGTETVQPDDQNELQYAASVTQTTRISRAGANDINLFGVVGGDPAMNGIQTYLAFYQNPADGWQVFRIGDFLNYTVLSQAPGRLVLSVRENFMGGANNSTIGVRWRRLTISWRPSRDDDAPTSLRVTSAAGR